MKLKLFIFSFVPTKLEKVIEKITKWNNARKKNNLLTFHFYQCSLKYFQSLYDSLPAT